MIRAKESVMPINNAIGSSFTTLFNQISTQLQTGNALIDAFVSTMISSLGKLLITQIQSLVTEKAVGVAKFAVNKTVSNANAVTAATATAASLGPAGAFALPGLIAGALATVNGAFAAIPAFAKGGFSGDNNLAWLNRDELVLRPTEMATLYNAIRNNNLSRMGCK